MIELEPRLAILLADSVTEANRNVSHADFVAGAQSGTLGFTCVGIEPYQLITGVRRRIFSILVFLYAVVPFAAAPLWAWHKHNWWLLFGVIASLIGTGVAARLIHTEKKQNSVGGLLLFGFLVSWFLAGFHSYPTFFVSWGLWGFMLFNIADTAERDYALDSLIESPELFSKAVAQNRIMIVHKETDQAAAAPAI